MRALIDALPEPVLVCDERDRVRIANPAATKLFAGRPVRDAHDLLSRFEPLPGPLPATDAPVTLRPHAIPNRVFELQAFPVERAPSDAEEARARDAGNRAGGTGESMASGGRIIMLRDVTAAREERAQRRAFLSILSHELRTPITTIYAGSRVLARRDPPRDHGWQEIARDISAEAARLYDVVEDLLVLARVEDDLLELSDEPILLQRVVEAAIRVASGRAPDVAVVVVGGGEPAAIRGDVVYVEQVVRNLVTAATRFGGPGQPVVIRLAEGEHEVSLSALDRGPDLTPAQLESSFGLTDDGGVRAAGIGIGLYVCRRLIEAMNGRIWARPREGGGAELGFALPRYEPE